MKYYAGIGARSTPKEILKVMTKAAKGLESKGYILRSGGAKGADSAFEDGVISNKNKLIFLGKGGACEEALKEASKFHPAWEGLSIYVKGMMGRNTYQILGRNLKHPAKFVICWTPDGKTVGGTGQSIRMANYYKIPIINLGSHSIEEANIIIRSLMLKP